jgi:hypothetical protein
MSTQTDLEAKARAAWEAGFSLAINYGDNYVHCQGEQRERQWKAHWDSACSLTQPKEGLEADNERLRALVQVLVDAGDAMSEDDIMRIGRAINEAARWKRIAFGQTLKKGHAMYTHNREVVQRVAKIAVDGDVSPIRLPLKFPGLVWDGEIVRPTNYVDPDKEHEVPADVFEAMLKNTIAAAKEQGFTPTNTETPTSEGSTTLAPTNTEGNG